MDYEFHELCTFFPKADDQIIEEMAADIKAHGLQEPILLYEGKILDGRNRYLACKKAGVNPIFEQFTGDNPFYFVVSKNLHRRHLNDSQRALIAAQVKAKIAMMPKEYKEGITHRNLANQFNVSEDELTRAVVLNHDGAREIINNVQNGLMTLNKATGILRQSKKRAGINDTHPSLVTKNQRQKMYETQLELLETPEIQDSILAEKERRGISYENEKLTGVYDAFRFRKSVRAIQSVIARLVTIPSLFSEAAGLIGTLEQERMLSDLLMELKKQVTHVDSTLRAGNIAYEEVVKLVASIINTRFTLPDMEAPKERIELESIRQNYIDACRFCLHDIVSIQKQIKQSVGNKQNNDEMGE